MTQSEEHKIAERKIAASNRELFLLNAVGHVLACSLEMEEILYSLMKLLSEEIDVQAGRIFVYNQSENRLEYRDSWCLSDEDSALFNQSNPENCDCHNFVSLSQMDIHPQRLDSCSFPSLLISKLGLKYSYSIPLLAKGNLQGLLELFADNCEVFNEDKIVFYMLLGQQVGTAIHNASLYSELSESHSNLEKLSRQLVNVQEEERKRLSRELHDEVGEIVTGLSFSLQMIPLLKGEDADNSLLRATDLVKELSDKIRNLTLALRPPMLDDLGLLPTLKWHFDRYESRNSIKVQFEHFRIDRRFTSEHETTVYRIVQEALTNVARHSGSKEVYVRITYEDYSIVIFIENVGKPFDVNAAFNAGITSGLAGMRERALSLGGTFSIQSTIQLGTSLEVTLPVDKSELNSGSE